MSSAEQGQEERLAMIFGHRWRIRLIRLLASGDAQTTRTLASWFDDWTEDQVRHQCQMLVNLKVLRLVNEGSRDIRTSYSYRLIDRSVLLPFGGSAVVEFTHPESGEVLSAPVTMPLDDLAINARKILLGDDADEIKISISFV